MLEHLADAPSIRFWMFVDLRQVERLYDRRNSFARFDQLGTQLLVEIALC